MCKRLLCSYLQQQTDIKGQPCMKMSPQVSLLPDLHMSLCVLSLWCDLILSCFSVSSGERQQVLGALERLQAKLVQREEWSHSDAVGNLRETLQSPLFSHILTLQHSIKQLRNQVRHTACCLREYTQKSE